MASDNASAGGHPHIGSAAKDAIWELPSFREEKKKPSAHAKSLDPESIS